MITFNSDNIFVGYLKQLLASFNLPTCKIYTKEHAKYKKEFGKERYIVASMPKTNNAADDKYIRYLPYIKDGLLQQYVKTVKNGSIEYSWIPIIENNPLKKIDTVSNTYYYNKKIPNITKQFVIKNNYYDNYTHEYLGNYLRFLRDYTAIDLMPLYNCFGGQICTKLDLNFDVITVDTYGNTIEQDTKTFSTIDNNYKIYMLPVKLFKKYTIAVDSDLPIEMCCYLYGKTQNNNEVFKALAKATYQKVQSTKFNQPFLYTKLVDMADIIEIGAKNNHTNEELRNDLQRLNLELGQKESNLKLFIKVPISNKSSITILEGDYLNWNDSINFSHKSGTTGEIDTITDNETPILKVFSKVTNKFISNYSYKEQLEDIFRPITQLQLLTLNTGTSYPFSDTLIEYLSDNVITGNETIIDNIIRVQKILQNNKQISYTDGLWREFYRIIFYDYVNNNTRLTNKNKEILGYVDKTIEKYYSSKSKNGIQESIENADIYEDLYKGDKK